MGKVVALKEEYKAPGKVNYQSNLRLVGELRSPAIEDVIKLKNHSETLLTQLNKLKAGYGRFFNSVSQHCTKEELKIAEKLLDPFSNRDCEKLAECICSIISQHNEQVVESLAMLHDFYYKHLSNLIYDAVVKKSNAGKGIQEEFFTSSGSRDIEFRSVTLQFKRNEEDDNRNEEDEEEEYAGEGLIVDLNKVGKLDDLSKLWDSFLVITAVSKITQCIYKDWLNHQVLAYGCDLLLSKWDACWDNPEKVKQRVASYYSKRVQGEVNPNLSVVTSLQRFFTQWGYSGASFLLENDETSSDFTYASNEALFKDLVKKDRSAGETKVLFLKRENGNPELVDLGEKAKAIRYLVFLK